MNTEKLNISIQTVETPALDGSNHTEVTVKVDDETLDWIMRMLADNAKTNFLEMTEG